MTDKAKPFAIEMNSFKQDPAITHVILSGFLDAHTVIEFEREMDARIRDGYCRFIMDLGNLNYTSSAGIGALMRLVHQLSAVNGDMVLLSPTQKVLDILNLLDFVKIFKMASSLDQAKSFLQDNPS